MCDEERPGVYHGVGKRCDGEWSRGEEQCGALKWCEEELYVLQMFRGEWLGGAQSRELDALSDGLWSRGVLEYHDGFPSGDR